MEEYKKAKGRISLSKASGPDNIPPEVDKKCDIDKIILDFANRLLINSDKPAQWSISNNQYLKRETSDKPETIVESRSMLSQQSLSIVLYSTEFNQN